MQVRFAIGLLVFAVLAAVGCSGTSRNERPSAGSTKPDSLYNRVGEQKLRAVVNDTVDMSAKDPKVGLDRAGKAAQWQPTPENVADFKRGLFQFVADVAGGPQDYRGKDMASAHKGMNITGEQFDAMMTHLQAAMDKNKVPAEEQRELKQVFNGTRAAIVQKPQTN